MECCCHHHRRQDQSIPYDRKEFSGLHLASKVGDIDEVKKLINNEPDLHTALSNIEPGCTPLHVAVTYNRTRAIKTLLKKGSDFTLKDDANETPLHIAFKNYSHQSIHLILQAYYTACSQINEEIKEALVKKEIPIDTSITIHDSFLEKFSPLHFAVTFELLDIIPILIDNGIDVGAIDSNGMTALHCAVQHTQTGLMQMDYLHKTFAKIHHSKRDNIYIENLVIIINLLLRSGCDINAQDNFGKPPMFYLFDKISNRANVAIHLNFDLGAFLARRCIIRKLLSSDPDLLAKDHEGNTILHTMAKAGDDFYQTYKLEIAYRYFQVGGNANELNNAGHSALHYACESGYKDLVGVLLRSGADVNLTQAEDRERPIHAVVRYLSQVPRLSIGRQIALIQELLHHGAYVDAEMTDGTTPILLATGSRNYASNIPLILCLFSWGCNLNCADAKGRTPLHNICQLKYLQLVEEFLWHGADVNAVDVQGNTPFSVAFSRLNFDLINCLDVYSWLKRLTILGAPLCQENRELYQFLEDMNGDMLEVGKSILDRKKFHLERIMNRKEYAQKLKEMPTEEQCRAELEAMKTMRIDADTSLYDILHMNTKVSHYSRNENANVLVDYYLDYCPVYGSLVQGKLRITIKGLLLKRNRQHMKKIFQADMPDVFNRIFSHFKHEDFVNFNQAFTPEKKKDETEPSLCAKRLRLG